MNSRPCSDTAGADRNTTLTGPNGEHLVVPPEIFEVLRRVVDAMANGQAVTIAPVHQRLTTQEAAELLGISRQRSSSCSNLGRFPSNSRAAIDEYVSPTSWNTAKAVLLNDAPL
jgi:hypothetical protein